MKCAHCGSKSMKRPFDLGFAKMMINPLSVLLKIPVVATNVFNTEKGCFQVYQCRECKNKSVHCEESPAARFSKNGCGRMTALYSDLDYMSEYTCPSCSMRGIVQVD